jgi:two-component system nitrate/nitrite response regulator NarL
VIPGVDGITAPRSIAERAPEVAILLLTSSADEDLGLLGLKAGAVGHLVKGISMGELLDAVRRVAAGEPVLMPAVARRLLDRLRALPDGGLGVRPVRSDLTTREWEVLDLLCADMTVDQIADHLVLSRETVRTHVKRILRKLGVHSQREAVELANGMRATFSPGSLGSAPSGPGAAG